MAIVYQDGVAGKICANPECEWKPLSEFGPARLFGIPVRDGYKSRCRDCFNAQKRSERAAKPEQYKESARKYVESNQDHIREIKRAHQKENPELYEAASRRYLDSHREEYNAKARERRQENLEHYREIGRKSYHKHREERALYSRIWAKLNRAKALAQCNRRRARKREAEGSHTIQEWESLKATYSFTCLACEKREPNITLTRDHIVPLEKGGSDSITNIQPLCARCNSKKNNKTIDYRNNEIARRVRQSK